MMDELPKQYNPKESENKCYQIWEEKKLFSAQAASDKRPFCIVIPPPNVTGILHMGHALNNTYQDILIRLKRMQGFESLWMPGTDHAGIATQNVVERQIAKEGSKRQDLGRDKFLERVWLWKEEYGSTIIKQLKKLGASCDWGRTRFTMDDEYSQSVKEVFIRLYEKGLIYQGSYIINWCPRCQTALSDEEAVHHEIDGNLYHIKYPIIHKQDKQSEQPGKHIQGAGDYIVVATTRPETMLGDTAVAVNPKDKRYKNLIGKSVLLPLVEREITIISDELVDTKFGTGAVKVTPAHDPNDYEMGKRHNLEFINILRPDGVLNNYAGEYSGLDRFEAREAIIEDLKERKLIEKVQPHKHAVGHCYRCSTVVEPYLSKQWFVKMQPLTKPAIEAVKKGEIKFYPKRWTKVYLNWMENIRDWCISRQIWWGHRLPVYYCKNCLHLSQQTGGIIVSRAQPSQCPICGSGDIYQDEDVLDTWFSSWLWPFATFYWPFSDPKSGNGGSTDVRKKDLEYFYPTSVLITAPEIIFFWVARMSMAGFEFMGQEPFKHVYIHGTVRDTQGRKMSKSLGNSIDPLTIIDKYGADALRFSLMSITSTGQDVFLSEQKFELGRNFANKLWNASRFALMNLPPMPYEAPTPVLENEKLGLPEKWILSRFQSLLISLNKFLDNYRFNDAANTLYEFIWHEFCDWYLELSKPALMANDEKTASTRIILYYVLKNTLICLHPFMPFITEEIWQKLNTLSSRQDDSRDSIMLEVWPTVNKKIVDKPSEEKIKTMIEVITAIRNLKSQMRIADCEKVKVTVVARDSKTERNLKKTADYIISLTRLKNLSIETGRRKIKNSISSVVSNIQIFLELEGLIDIPAEINRLKAEINKLTLNLDAKEVRLRNKDFIKKAPEEIIEKEKISIAAIKETISKLTKISDELQK